MQENQGLESSLLMMFKSCGKKWIKGIYLLNSLIKIEFIENGILKNLKYFN